MLVRQMKKLKLARLMRVLGFIFKIQANMDPKHRDRIAFMRVVSGAFERGMDVTLQRTNKNKNHTFYLFYGR